MNKDELKGLLNYVYEVEGLIELAIRRGDDTPNGIYRLIADKCCVIANSVSEWNIEDDTVVAGYEDYAEEAVDEVILSESVIPAVDDADTTEHNVMVGVNDSMPDEDIEVEFVYPEEETAEDESIEDDTAEDVETEDVETIEETTSSLFDASAFDVDDDDDAMQSETLESESDITYISDQDSEPDEQEYEDESIDDYSDDDEYIYTYDDENEDDAVTTSASDVDLRRLFTINDRYRFRRELFSNSDVDFNDNLNLVQAMASYEDAEDYFYNDLQWDVESKDVVEFMSIIYRYFNTCR